MDFAEIIDQILLYNEGQALPDLGNLCRELFVLYG